MEFSRVKSWMISVLVVLASAAAIAWIYPRVHPLAALYLPHNAAEMGRMGTGILRTLHVDAGETLVPAELRRDDDILRFVYKTYGTERGNALVRDSIPAYSWAMQWIHLPSGWSMAQGGTDVVKVTDKSDKPIRLRLSATGSILEFDRAIPDSSRLPSLAPGQARIIAEEFLTRFSPEFRGLRLERERHMDLGHRTDHEFVWSSDRTVGGVRPEFTVRVAGDMVSVVSLNTPLPPAQESDTNTYHSVISAIGFVVLIVLMVVVGIRRVRAYEINFRQGLVLGILVAFLFGLELYFSLRGVEGIWQAIASIAIAPLFVGGAFVLAWAVTEAVTREASPGKFTTLDLVANLYPFHSLVGVSVIRGIAMGMAALVIWMSGAWLAGKITSGVYIIPDKDALAMFSGVDPSVRLLLHNTYNALFVAAVFIFFPLSLLRHRLKSQGLFLLVGALIFGFLDRDNLQPVVAGVLVSALAAAVIIWGYRRYDVLAVIVALITFSSWLAGASLLTAGNPGYTWSGGVLAGLFGAAAIAALFSILTKDRQFDLDAITPVFVKHITERERLQRELEIARDVQMSFLPKKNPSFGGVEIASRCAPAQEVGGDYYDFIDLGGGRFGVAIGDVSGKGTQAAFYMTLTKGFLKAVTKTCPSPAAVLTQLNNLFYENVDRGTFISMVYGIFDVPRMTLVLARAGHNPVITRKTTGGPAEFVVSSGLALGLEAGPTFARTIQETEIRISPGDLFVFYTDGFPEAMNRAHEEYGEDRLREAVTKLAGGSAEEVMQGIFDKTKQFTGRAGQHDDMTIVVVRIC